MTQRLKGISDDEATGVVKQIFDTSNQLLGRTANLVRILCHSPYVARWFLPLVAARASGGGVSRTAEGGMLLSATWGLGSA
ncbi:MAG: hypothetical protein Q8L40_03740, partial [Burkholderiales bacterium]|nr:hypothetical protein [Burkholderiales bacterium]